MKSLNTVFKLLLFPFILVGHFFSSAGNVVSIGDYKGLDSASAHKINLFLLFFLIFSSTHLYATSHTFVPDPINTVTDHLPSLIPPNEYTYSDSAHSASKKDFVYYKFQFDQAGDVIITVNDIDTSAVRFNYNTSAYPFPDWDEGNTTETLSVAQNDTIWLAISDSAANPSPERYQIIVTLTPTSTSSDSNLTITKTNSADIVSAGENFYYTINVKNIDVNMASDINVTDILPAGMDFNSTATNDSSPYWNCSENPAQTVTCEHNASNLLAANTHTIFMHVIAPSSPGSIENNATVTGVINSIVHSATASETTIITADVNNAENVCYVEASVANYGNYTSLEAACDKEGNFYYGQNCIASVIIVDTNASEDSILKLTVSKMYAPGLDHGTATATDGNLTHGNGPSTLTIAEYPSYTEGYVVYYAELTMDNNFTIRDTNSYNNGGKLYGIALYADYNISGIHHSGRIYACSGASEGNIEITTAADVIDTFIDSSNAGNYNDSVNDHNTSDDGGYIAYIRTMIASSPSRNIVGVHLDLNGTATQYDYNGSESPALAYSITPYLTDDTCTISLGNIIDPETGEQLVINILEGQYSAVETMIVPNIARKIARLQMIFVDPNGLSVEGQNCLANSSTTGNFARLAQCVNSEIQYKTAFGQDAWDRCGNGNGNPCVSANHGYSCGENDTSCTGYNQIYDNELGCYMCTFNITAACSTDNFAIRPNDFNATIINPFVAEHNTSVTFRADQYNVPLNGTGTMDYNETEYSSFVVDVNISDSNKTCAVPSIHFNPAIVFANGLADHNYTLDNVGDFNLTIHEINGSEFALVDVDDTPDATRLITPFETQIKVIPDHFLIDWNLTNAGNGFTYFSNFEEHNNTLDRNMSASLDMNISAKGEANTTLTNYTAYCYAKDGNITITLNNLPLNSNPDGNLTKLLWYDSLHDLNGSVPLPITANFTMDSNKTQFDHNDSNGTATAKYLINFDRNLTMAVNPMLLSIHDVNRTDTDNVQGHTTLDQNATFIYGRTHAPRYRFVGPFGNAFIYYESYLAGTGVKALLPNGIDSNITDDPRWFKNTLHTATADGEVGTVIQKGSDIHVTSGILVNVTGQTTAPLTYDTLKGYPYKATMENNASNWLIYNKYDVNATTNEFQVEFVNTGDWTGENETNVTTRKRSSVITNRRSMW
jgi:uncharacterized repeat protein (TIGR01451 family)